MEIIVRNMTVEAWKTVSYIYQVGMDSKNATFETKAPEWELWDKSHRKDCRLVAVFDGKVIGWAAISNISSRTVYSGVAEVSIYIDPDFQGQGVGSMLMKRLIEESEKNNIWTLQSGIFPENKASVNLHLKFGFRILGIREKIGIRDNQWRDVLLLERRSMVVGE